MTKSISIVQEANLDAAKRKYVKAKKAYYNSQPIMTDAEFDKMEDSIRRLDPSWKELKKTGVKTANKKTEVSHGSEPMPSLNKMYPEEVPKFFARPSSRKVKRWIIMDKLDGTSLKLIYENREPTKLITRGDGKNGGDISFFIPWLVRLGRIPEKIPSKDRVVFRIEALMQKKVFEKKWSKEFDNIRNQVNGIFNRRDQHPALNNVDMVVLGIYGMPMAKGIQTARAWGHQTVEYGAFPVGMESKHDDFLANKLVHRRLSSLYEMDGLVVAPADWVMEYKNADKPKETIAFKLNDEENADEVEVLEELWSKTRLNRWSCRVRIPPTEMDGVIVEYATAHNPAWMKEKGIGKGAVIKVLRSGGVIPKIVGVVKAAKFQGPPGKYELKGRFFYAAAEDKATHVQQILFFMRTMGIELLAEKTIEKLYDFTYKEPYDYLLIMEGGDARIAGHWRRFTDAGIGENQAEKLLNEIRRVLSGKISLRKLMVASGCFENGIGDRKLKLLEEAGISMASLMKYKDVEKDKAALARRILRVKGFSLKTAGSVVNGLIEFKLWFGRASYFLKVDGSLPEKINPARQLLAGVKVAFTGYRSEEQEQVVIDNGGEVGSFSGKTTHLLYKDGGKASSKVEKAGSRATTWAAFAKQYKL
jgi:DNA ligase (NAD+)